MKCEFETTKIRSFLTELFAFFAVMSFIFVFVFASIDQYKLMAFTISLIVFVLSVIGVIAARLFNGGTISAGEKEVVISYNFMGKKAVNSHIDYDEIDCAEFQIEGIRSRVLFYYYRFTLVIKKKSEEEVKVAVNLVIDEDFPIEKPEEYKQYLAGQPIMQMCKYINERVGNNE